MAKQTKTIQVNTVFGSTVRVLKDDIKQGMSRLPLYTPQGRLVKPEMQSFMLKQPMAIYRDNLQLSCVQL
jgi:hypothetical protein